MDKDILAAEINKRISRNKKRKEWENIPEKRHQLIIEGQLLGEFKHFLDSLEAKEVDLEKEIKDYFDNQPIITRSKGVDYQFIPSGEVIARHFFELGLKAAQKGE